MEDVPKTDWPLRRAGCQNVGRVPCFAFLAMTVAGETLPPRAMAFSQIVDRDVLFLLRAFLDISSRAHCTNRARLFLEGVRASESPAIRHYTFILALQDGFDAGLALDAFLAKEAKARKLKDMDAIPIWMLKDAVARYSGFRLSVANEAPDEMNGEKMTPGFIWSMAHALAARTGDVLETQDAWHGTPYFGDAAGAGAALVFPNPELVYEIDGESAMRPDAVLLERYLPAHQIAARLRGTTRLVDEILARPALPGGGGAYLAASSDQLDSRQAFDEFAPADEPPQPSRREALSRCFRAQGFGAIDMTLARPELVRSGPEPHTYEELRAASVARLVRIEEVAKRAGKWSDVRDGTHAARRLLLEHQAGTIELYGRHLRGAFSDNVSPTRARILQYAKDMTLPRVDNSYSDLDDFSYRVWRQWEWIRDVFMVAPHNVRHADFAHRALLDAYDFECKTRVALNFIFHSETPGTGKSNILMEVIPQMRVPDTTDAFKHVTLRAKTSDFYEQCDRTVLRDELPQDYIQECKYSNNEPARMFKEGLTNPEHRVLAYFCDEETGAKVPKESLSLWIQAMGAAANIKSMLSTVMVKPIRDRFVIFAFDESREAVEAIREKQFEEENRRHLAQHLKDLEEASAYYRAEQVLYDELKKLERVAAVRPATYHGAEKAYRWIFRRLEEKGIETGSARDNVRIRTLSTIVAGLDAIARVYFDRGGPQRREDETGAYDFTKMVEVERRNVVWMRHVVYTVGLAPELFVSVHDRDIRRALKRLFLNQDAPDISHLYARDEAGGMDATFVRLGAGYDGLDALAAKVRTELSEFSPNDRRLVPSIDCIADCLGRWRHDKRATRSWHVVGSRWPTEDSTTPLVERPLVQVRKSGAGWTTFVVQAAWLDDANIPPPAEEILLGVLRELFAHRYQGGFVAPYGENPKRRGHLRFARFPPAAEDAPLLEFPSGPADDEDAYDALALECSLDEYANNERNKLLYVQPRAVSRLADVPLLDPEDDDAIRDCKFFGVPLREMLPNRTVDYARVVDILDAKPTDDEDCDAPRELIAFAGVRESNIWDAWTADVDRRDFGRLPAFVRPTPRFIPGAGYEIDMTGPELGAIYGYNRGNYKCVAMIPSVEEARICATARRRHEANKRYCDEEEGAQSRLTSRQKWNLVRGGGRRVERVQAVTLPVRPVKSRRIERPDPMDEDDDSE